MPRPVTMRPNQERLFPQTLGNLHDFEYFCVDKILKIMKIRSYGKAELAQLYSPYITPSAARKKLRFWIGLQPKLLQALQEIGYTESAKSFTPAQVRLIVEAIGEP